MSSKEHLSEETSQDHAPPTNRHLIPQTKLSKVVPYNEPVNETPNDYEKTFFFDIEKLL